MDGYDFRELLYSLGIIHLDQLADKLHLSAKTIKRYTTPGYRVPMHSVAAVLLISGRINHKRWQRWKFNTDGKLIDPWGHSYWPDEICNVQIYRDALQATDALQHSSENFIEGTRCEDQQYLNNQQSILK